MQPVRTITTALLAALMAVPLAAQGAQASFEVRHELKVKVPEGARKARVWFAVPQDEPAQRVTGFKVEAPWAWRLEKDSQGNKVLYAEAQAPAAGEITILTTFDVTRSEVRSGVDAKTARPLNEEEKTRFAKDLAPNKHVIIDDRIKTLSAEIAGTETNPVTVARRIYDWELENVEYWVKDPNNKKASPVGSTDHCLTTKTGNCTDFHSLWASLARARGIPTRLVYGVFLKKELDGKDTDSSYHCWPEFYVPGQGWVPHDVAVADIFAGEYPINADNESKVKLTTADGYSGPDPKKVEYYFGNLEARRVVFSAGRDIVLNPPADAGPVNALPKAHVEIDGKPAAEKETWNRKLTYKEKK